MKNMEAENLLKEITERSNRDDGEKFTVDDRSKYIKNVLKESDYEIWQETSLAIIYRRKETDLPEQVVLLSSHVDVEKRIKKLTYESMEGEDYSGTFDNSATNAALVTAMLRGDLAENVVVAFTGDEEKKCRGAKQVIDFLKEEHKKVIGIALDVTFDGKTEGEWENKSISLTNIYSVFDYASYTIENLCGNTEERAAKALFKEANSMGIPYMVVRVDEDEGDDFFLKFDRSDYYKPEVEVEGTAYEDEALEVYGESDICIGAFSLCLPSDDKDDRWKMHSDKPIRIKRKSYEDYIEAIIKISSRLALES